MSIIFRWFAPCAVWLLLAAAPPLRAVEYCVGSVSELDVALAVASLPTGQATVIKLRQGTYAVAGSLLSQGRDYRAMQLLGGYGPDCSTRTLRPANTIIDGGGQGLGGMYMQGDLLMEGLRFQNIAIPFGGIFIRGPYQVHVDHLVLTLRNNEFSGIGVNVAPGNVDEVLRLDFINNLVVAAPRFGLLLGYGYESRHGAFVANNTIVGSGEHGIIATTQGSLLLQNNVAWDNTLRDIWVEGDEGPEPGSAVYRDNLYGTRFGDEAPGSFGSLHDDPLFVDEGGGNLRLQATSPGVNSGSQAPNQAGTDLDGNSRVVGSTIDRGAYETTVDDTVPTTLVVANANDSGAGSLRQAIISANANPDFSYIDFDIPGSCPRTINLASALPTITTGVRINGWTQPGSSANTHANRDNASRCVIVNGGSSVGVGLDYNAGAGAQFWLQGLAFGGFNGYGLRIRNGTDALVWGNQFGGRVGSVDLLPSLIHIGLLGDSTSASVGGDNPAQRNVIADAIGFGIHVTGAGGLADTGNEIVGNLIGSWGLGTANAGNQTGIMIEAAGNSVRGNTIIHSGNDGIRISGDDVWGNQVEDNRIGRAWPICLPPPFGCTPEPAPNLRHGVRIESWAHDNSVSRNTIWHNGNTGVSIAGEGRGNRLAANSIYDNAGWGIDLDGTGPNDNDSDGNAADEPNRGINYPVILRAWGGTRNGRVEGTLASLNNSYRIELFSSAQPDNMPNGEGEVFHGSGVAVINDATPALDGSTGFDIAFSSPSVSLAGRSIALTATDAAGNSSEFSFSIDYQCDVIFRNGMEDAEGEQCPLP